MTPLELAPQLQSLPPILHMEFPNSKQSYSKGARGLFVFLRLTSPHLHVQNSISLSPLLRQWGSRYAIRAGRNLPDKEFRYLRTVIVTAAVYRGFGSLLRVTLTTHLNLPAPGRRQTLYVHLCLQSPVFLVNSRYPLLHLRPQKLCGRKSTHL
jgi:hypothetical protein